MSQDLIVSLDLGGTYARLKAWHASVHPLDTPPLFEEKFAHHRLAPEVLIDNLANIILERIPQLPKHFLFSASIAAMLDPSHSIIRNAPNLQWKDIPFAQLLKRRLPQLSQVLLFNDLKAATFGEYTYANEEGCSDILSVFVGSGVGAGFVLKGILQEGAKGVAGEFGHCKVVPKGGRACGCGGFGCLEAYVGGHHLSQIAFEEAQRHPDSFLGRFLSQHPEKKIHPALLSQGAEENDLLCLDILQKAGELLGWSIANAITLLNPQLLILGGSILQHIPILRRKTLETLQMLVSTPALDDLHIREAQLGDDAGLLGAFALAQRQIKVGHL